jgi:two-component system, LuxR family, response regulator FixJ
MSGASQVYVVKDDGPTRQTLTSLLAAAGIPSRSFDSRSDFLEACETLPSGCVVTNFQSEGIDAFEFLRRLRQEPVSFPAIVIASGGEVLKAVEAMKAGAATVLERPYVDEILLGAVRSALEVDARATTQTAQRTALDTLTRREVDVLSGLLEGKTNKMTARHLGISSRTVEIYRASVMKKTGLSSVAELVRLSLGAELANGLPMRHPGRQPAQGSTGTVSALPGPSATG